jgi:1-acyl-sn-glycerol-3-phosphate acyltransferase
MDNSSAMNKRPTASAPASWFRSGYEYLVYYGGLALFGAMCLAWSLAAYPLAWLLPERAGRALGRRVIRFGFSAYLRVLEGSGIVKCDLAALDALRQEPSLIIAPNHPSLIDVVLIASRLPNVVCIIKAALSDQIMFGGSAKLAGYIRSATRTKLVIDATRELEIGSQLLIFPEGTRTEGATLQPFKGGFALIAKRANAPVQTVFIEISQPFLCKHRPLWRKPVFPLCLSVRLGQRFAPPEDVQSSVFELEDYYRAQMAHGRTAEP